MFVVFSMKVPIRKKRPPLFHEVGMGGLYCCDCSSCNEYAAERGYWDGRLDLPHRKFASALGNRATLIGVSN